MRRGGGGGGGPGPRCLAKRSLKRRLRPSASDRGSKRINYSQNICGSLSLSLSLSLPVPPHLIVVCRVRRHPACRPPDRRQRPPRISHPRIYLCTDRFNERGDGDDDAADVVSRYDDDPPDRPGIECKTLAFYARGVPSPSPSSSLCEFFPETESN